MKKKSFLNGMNAKLALLVMALSGVLLTGCYKDDGLDASAPGGGTIVADAVYTITGSVIDEATGEPMEGYTVVPSKGEYKAVKGSYSVVVGKFTTPTETVELTFTKGDYITVKRTVILTKVEDGNSAVYPLSVYMKKAQQVETETTYNLKFVVKDSKTGAEAAGVTIPDAMTGKEGGKPFTVSTTATDKYYGSLTVIDLPVVYGNQPVAKIIELFVTPIEPGVTAPDTYVNIAGNIVDKNGKALKATVELLNAETSAVIETAENVDAFRFTILSTNAVKKYKVKATYKTETETSNVIDINGGNISFSLVFDNVGDVTPPTPVFAKYTLAVNVLDAATKAPIKDFTFTVDGVAYEGGQLAYGDYIVAVADKAGLYYASSTKVTLEKVESSEVIKRVVEVYLTKIPAIATKTIKLYGEVVDKSGKMVIAQKISLSKNPLIQPVYKSDHYEFTVEVPGTNLRKAANAKRWTAVAKFMDAQGALTQDYVVGQFEYNGDATISAIYTCIPLSFNVNADGKIESAGEGDGSQGELEPDLDENGALTSDLSTNMSDGTKLNLKQGTIIKDANGNPLTTNIYVTRSTSEEGSIDDSEGTTLRCYYGIPDGTTFENHPLEIQFADKFGGELGGFALEYFTDGKWMTPVGEKGNVVTNNATYTMNVYHFSRFRAAMKGLLELMDTNKDVVVRTKEVGKANYEETVKEVEVTYSYLKGNEFVNSLEASIQEAGFANAEAIKFVAQMIQQQLKNKNIDVMGMEKAEGKSMVKVAPLSVLNSVSATQSFSTENYTFIIGGKTIKFSVKMAGQVDLSTDTTYFGHGHGHGHGHGDDLNSGGGIIIPE